MGMFSCPAEAFSERIQWKERVFLKSPPFRISTLTSVSLHTFTKMRRSCWRERRRVHAPLMKSNTLILTASESVDPDSAFKGNPAEFTQVAVYTEKAFYGSGGRCCVVDIRLMSVESE